MLWADKPTAGTVLSRRPQAGVDGGFITTHDPGTGPNGAGAGTNMLDRLLASCCTNVRYAAYSARLRRSWGSANPLRDGRSPIRGPDRGCRPARRHVDDPTGRHPFCAGTLAPAEIRMWLCRPTQVLEFPLRRRWDVNLPGVSPGKDGLCPPMRAASNAV